LSNYPQKIRNSYLEVGEKDVTRNATGYVRNLIVMIEIEIEIVMMMMMINKVPKKSFR
jgi:hypothetical protein